MDSAKKFKFKISKRSLIFSILILLVLSISFFLIANKNSKQSDASVADNLFLNNDFSSSIKIFEEQYEKESDNLKKAELAYKISQNYLGLENYNDAKIWSKKSLDHYNSISEKNDSINYSIMVINNDIKYIDGMESISKSSKDNVGGSGESSL